MKGTIATPKSSEYLGKDQLTILIPTFNGEATIGRALSSVIFDIESNELQNLVKVIIIDNCSTDSTNKIVRKIAVDRSYIQIHKTKSNVGLDGNLRIGVGLVSSKFVKILCDDDLVIPGYIPNLLLIIKANPDADLVVSSMQAFREN